MLLTIASFADYAIRETDASGIAVEIAEPTAEADC
jgi:hypothetical protein